MNKAAEPAGLSLVVMGVAGCGKSTLARGLADRLCMPFVEGDELHPPTNVAKMAAGIPLEDRDRDPFLAAVAGAIASAGPQGVVVSCSALKRRYRNMIVQLARRPVCFVLPELSVSDLEHRIGARTGHFMPASLLKSQLAVFEALQPDECAVKVDGLLSTTAQVDRVVAALPP